MRLILCTELECCALRPVASMQHAAARRDASVLIAYSSGRAHYISPDSVAVRACLIWEISFLSSCSRACRKIKVCNHFENDCNS